MRLATMVRELAPVIPSFKSSWHAWVVLVWGRVKGSIEGSSATPYVRGWVYPASRGGLGSYTWYLVHSRRGLWPFSLEALSGRCPVPACRFGLRVFGYMGFCWLSLC